VGLHDCGGRSRRRSVEGKESAAARKRNSGASKAAARGSTP